MATDAFLAIIADGGQAIVDINRETSRNKLISCLIHFLILNSSKAASAKPFCRGSWGWGMFLHKNLLLERQTTLSWLRCLCAVCFASQKSLPNRSCLFLPEQT
jgi:hypothetical protein